MLTQKFSLQSLNNAAETPAGRDFIESILKNTAKQSGLSDTEIPPDTTVSTESKITAGALRVLEPIINAAILYSGDNESIINNANKLFNDSLKVKELIIKQLDSDRQLSAWVNHQAFGVAFNWVASEWKANHRDIERFFVDNQIDKKLSSVLVNDAEKVKSWLEKSTEPDGIYSEQDAISQIRFSMSKAFFPLFMDIQEFSFWKNRISEESIKNFSKSLYDNLNEVAATYANHLCDAKSIDNNSRFMLWQSSINRTFSIAQSHYNKLTDKALLEVDNAQSKEEKASIRAKWAKSDIDQTIINHTANTLGEFTGLIENYIEHNLQTAVSQPKKGYKL